ncbi:hypothetical protein ElyMa_002134300 [Elysia marginata]|uniref:Uncharacterized protein n=1 Tax=Elysia marginata TaxID=1093978 RepID=A0AAV4FLU0_9GAST|nr:hypothetical protein ElyMa_002134300 [Elysia marginata]
MKASSPPVTLACRERSLQVCRELEAPKKQDGIMHTTIKGRSSDSYAQMLKIVTVSALGFLVCLLIISTVKTFKSQLDLSLF